MRKILFICLLILCLLTATKVKAQDFPYPSMPQTLATTEARGAYLIEHYWDNFSFSDTALIHQPELTEQGFANFVDLLPRFGDSIAVRGVSEFSRKAFAPITPRPMREYMAKLTEHYLYNPNSPLHSDALFVMFLQEMSHSDGFDLPTREHYAYIQTNVAKNMPGTVATDFVYIDRNGHQSSLHTTQGEYILIYFNDPDCDNCHEVTAQLRTDSLFVNNPRLTFLAVYADSDTELWKTNPQPFPASWIDAYSPEGEITTKQLYFINATPTIYLLDSEKRVLLKDPSIELLKQCLNELLAQ